MNNKIYSIFSLFLFLLLNTGIGVAQISSPDADGVDITFYPTFTETDSIFIFCTEDSTANVASLRTSSSLSGTKTFLWEQYDSASGDFVFYFSENRDDTESRIDNLTDGCYRVTITQGGDTRIHRAWVFNNWSYAQGEVTDSDCEGFSLNGNFSTADLVYYDLVDNSPVEVYKDTQVRWMEGEVKIASTTNMQIFDPPTEDTEYTFEVYDKFDCTGSTEVIYESIVTKAAFSVNPGNGEAPLEVTFNNESENGDPGLFEWFLFRDLDEIKREYEETGGPVDSIMIVAYDDSPVYTYENSGTYNVKMVSKKVSEFHTCVDTVYMDDYIIVDTSFIEVPNVFTPNGDGTNDNFVVKFWSMQSIQISIFNRWGRRIHAWKSDNIRGFEGTWTETVWDGRLAGGRYASPGVYYYTIVGEGRDGRNRRSHGFFHLFRGKD